MIRRRVQRPGTSAVLVSGLALLCSAGCGGQLDTSYGRSRGESINGTGVVAELFRESGHKVRTARRLNQELDEWADVIVRFAPLPGPLEHDEARWYNEWLSHEVGRALIYVLRDYDAQVDYWSAVLEGLPRDAPAAERTRAQKLRDRARKLHDEVEKTPGLPPSDEKETTAHEDWFAVEVPKTNTTEVCKVLAGPWGRGIDAQRASLPRHATFKVRREPALLTGDDRPLVIERDRPNDSRVLAVASGAFLLNAALVNPARRPLALRVVDWVGESPRKVAFVEGDSLLGSGPPAQSIFALLRVPPFGWVAAQMFALGLAGCLARAPRLGRARLDPPSDADRPAAHAEALGSLLARTGQPEQARAALDAFRQWRKKAGGRGGRAACSNERDASVAVGTGPARFVVVRSAALFVIRAH